jgi:hypothetical protein
LSFETCLRLKGVTSIVHASLDVTIRWQRGLRAEERGFVDARREIEARRGG